MMSSAACWSNSPCRERFLCKPWNTEPFCVVPVYCAEQHHQHCMVATVLG